MGQYGHFTDDGLEYVITTPHTPRDWFNFLWNPTYLASVGGSMNGCSLYQNDAGVVTNLFGKQDMREDPRWVYVRDNATGEVWSAGYFPCHTDHDAYEMRHGLGYSTLRTLKNGIQIEFRVFVPRKHMGEVWTITVSNKGKKARDLSVFTVANVMLDGVNMPYGYIGGLTAEFLPKDNMLFFRNMTYTVVDEKYRAFMHCDSKIARWDVSKDHFLGRTKNYACPQRVLDGELGNSIAAAEYLVGAVQHDLKLKKGAAKTMNFVLGIVLDEKEARGMVKAFTSAKQIDAELKALKAENIARLGGLVLATPDADFNRLFTVWMKHELYLMADWARFYFKGYRDTCQDSAGMSVINAPRALAMLEKALRNQRSDGFAPRAFRVASMDIAAADKHYCDSPSWISHATETILAETGDLSLLDRVVAYSDKGEGTIWEHNVRAMEFLWNDRGANGLSLIHYGDWCDLIDKAGHKGTGVSVWMSFATARVLKLVGAMAAARGENALAATCAERYATLAKAIRAHGWDGDHFLYAITDDGHAVGATRNKEGQYFINPQSWAVLSGVVEPAEYLKISRKFARMVETPVGPVTCWPPFTKYDHNIGQLTGTPSGFFTNGNVYCHAASFKVAADFEAGDTEKAWETFQRILPSAEKSEPYSQANGYVGPSAGRMRRHVSDDPWRTGTVAWNFLNCVDRLLGFRRVVGGVHIRPMIPAKWPKAAYERPFRGTVFAIEVRRGANPGLTVDGKPVAGDFIPVPKQGLGKKRVSVVCTVK